MNSMLHRIQDADAVGLGEALELVSQGFILIRPDGRIGFVNECAIKLLELPAWLINGPCRYRDLITWQMETGEYDSATPDHREFVKLGSMTSQTGKFQYARPNGTVLEVHYVPLRNREGGAVVSMLDVSVRVREAAFLAEQKERAEKEALAKEQFFAMMSHEMRTPLNGVLGIAEILADTKLSGEQRRHLAVLRESGDDLLRIINAVLDFSKMSTGDHFELESAAFDVRRAVRAAAATVRAQAEAKDIELRVDVADNVPQTLLGDVARLKQVLLNLLGNAVKFTDEGRVTVSVSCRAATDKARVRFEVRDTGIGIPKEARENLFDAFTQVDASVSRRFGGTGLGLAICRKIIEKMGSPIQVESTVGRGSAFSFEVELPVVNEKAADAVVALHMSPIPPKRILLAEDNATNTMVATELLSRMGHEVTAVSNGREAVAAAAAQDFDVVLMDVMMPEMDGLTASRVIKATERGRSLPIVALTANAQRDRHDASVAAGMEFVIQKPISRHRLEQGLHRLFGADNAGETAPTGAGATADDALPIVDRTTFEEFSTEMGPAALRMVETFMVETGKSVEELRHESDGLKIVRTAHSLKSSAALFGFAKLSALAAKLEKDGPERAGEEMISAIAQVFEETRAAAQAA